MEFCFIKDGYGLNLPRVGLMIMAWENSRCHQTFGDLIPGSRFIYKERKNEL